MNTLRIPIGIVAILLHFSSIQAQEVEAEKIPSIKMLRAEESYSFLKNDEPGRIFLQPLKLLPVTESKNVYLTLGGEYRARFESFTNKDYTPENDSYYSQRLDIHASLTIGSRLRFFGELYHGYTSGENRPIEDDQLDLHQGFLELTLFNRASSSLQLRAGRQELGFGISRLVGIREGPNMRRSFDLIKFAYKRQNRSLNIIYGKELSYGFDAFDNESNLFDKDGPNPELWGIYIQNNSQEHIINLDYYYLGFHSGASLFNDVAGDETRHSLGVRSHGSAGKFSFNSELIYQFGDIANSNISAYNFETDWKYRLMDTGWKPKAGLRLDFSSGDSRVEDGKIQTFNPLFVNPAIYSLAGVNTPANLTSLHPNLTLYPAKNFSIYVDYALFYRTQLNDGLYTPPRFLLREAGETSEKHIGDVIGLQIQYELNRNISMDLRSSYFIAGRFIKATGQSENTFYLAPTINFKF
ncbi:MAG: alginate export family protein [Bacteroidota bacterium]